MRGSIVPLMTRQATLVEKKIVLRNESIQLVSEWPKYQELENQINYLRKADLSFFSGDIQVVKDFVADFKKELPKSLETNAILSRVATIETMILKLHDNLTLNGVEDKVKLDNIKAVLVSFANLNYQINKKLEMDLYNKIQPE